MPEEPARPQFLLGDLAELREHGVLRVLTPDLEASRLARDGLGFDEELELVRELAAALGLEAEFLVIPDYDGLLPALEEGRGDIAIARLTASASRAERVDFTRPLSRVREMLVVREEAGEIGAWEDVGALEIAVRPSSSYRETLAAIEQDIPIHVVEVDETLTTEQILVRLAEGEWGASVADEDILEAVREYRPELRPAFALTEPQPIAWALRPGMPRLLDRTNRFLREHQLVGDLRNVARRDLAEVKKARVLRVLTRNNAATYFLYRGHPMGFEYELSERFAEELGCRLQVVVPPSSEDMIPWLLEGRGDMIASSYSVTEERARRVAFTRPYMEEPEILVVRSEDLPDVQTPADLAGRVLIARRSSAYWETLDELSTEIDFVLVPAPEEAETEELIGLVAEGEYDATLADKHILGIELAWREDVEGAFPIGEPREIAWALRPAATELHEAANAFLDEEYRGLFFNVVYKRYFEDFSRVARRQSWRSEQEGRISPFDELFREYAAAHDLDWRLVASQAYQESRFDPSRVSWAGARGLMQIMPRTARHLGVEADISDPEVGIEAGSRYLRWLADRFEPELPVGERMRFALASYNVGRGHVLDARRIARREARFDEDVWFGNVEEAMKLLSRPEYAARARSGYCRCREPIHYVREVVDRYRAYIEAGF